MIIEIKKFGEILTSRPAGREAYLVAKAYIVPNSGEEEIILSFDGVKVLTPSWADEFLSPFLDELGDRLVLLPSDNLSVQATLKILTEVSKKSFNFKK